MKQFNERVGGNDTSSIYVHLMEKVVVGRWSPEVQNSYTLCTLVLEDFILCSVHVFNKLIGD